MTAVYIVGIIVLVCLAFLIWAKTPKGKGYIGEFVIKQFLGKTKRGEKYVINNVMIVDEGKSSQIDHILVNKSGVFVIETKNYAGIIAGHQEQLEWSQTLAYGKVKNKFYNPIKQNATHVYRLKKLLNIDVPFYTPVVFVQANLKYVDAECVFTPFGLKKYIKRMPSTLTNEEIDNVANAILNIKDNTVSMKEHVKEINTMQNDIAKGICPRCGGNLVLRKSKNGDFYGCSNYPHCKFTKKI